MFSLSVFYFIIKGILSYEIESADNSSIKYILMKDQSNQYNCLNCNYPRDIKWKKSFPQFPELITKNNFHFWQFIKSIPSLSSLCHQNLNESLYSHYMQNILSITNNRLYVLFEGDSFTRITWISFISQYVIHQPSLELLKFNRSTFHLPHVIICHNFVMSSFDNCTVSFSLKKLEKVSNYFDVDKAIFVSIWKLPSNKASISLNSEIPYIYVHNYGLHYHKDIETDSYITIMKKMIKDLRINLISRNITNNINYFFLLTTINPRWNDHDPFMMVYYNIKSNYIYDNNIIYR